LIDHSGFSSILQDALIGFLNSSVYLKLYSEELPGLNIEDHEAMLLNYPGLYLPDDTYLIAKAS